MALPVNNLAENEEYTLALEYKLSWRRLCLRQDNLYSSKELAQLRIVFFDHIYYFL